MEGRIRIFTGIEVDILGDGAWTWTTRCWRRWMW